MIVEVCILVVFFFFFSSNVFYLVNKKFHTQMEDVLMFTAIVHKRLTSIPPGLGASDFLPEEQRLYDKISSDLFQQLSRISSFKKQFSDLQQRKLKRTLQTGILDLIII